jgi:hypothetical protein
MKRATNHYTFRKWFPAATCALNRRIYMQLSYIQYVTSHILTDILDRLRHIEQILRNM